MIIGLDVGGTHTDVVLMGDDGLLKEIKVLQELLPICSGCKRIRDEEGKWWPFDLYVKEKTEADLTHTMCNDCEEVFYPDLNNRR